MDSLLFDLKKNAGTAGFFYLLHIVLIIYGVIFVSSKMGISGTDAMANKILADEFLFRSGIVTRLLSLIPTLFLAFSLYRLFEKVDEFQAKFLFILIIISIPFQFIAEVFNLTSLMIVKGELLKSADLAQKHDLSVLLITLYNNMVSIAQIFWGLWLFPFGLLIYRSNFIPRIFGTILFLGGIGYLVDFTAFLLSPNYRSATVFALLLGFMSEIAIMFWLLLQGLKKNSIP
ncbi:MAG: DUF4386 domain-containing protein [Mucilaginibacter sp.]